jgi:isoquinoline 1-oxidoreductase beta subunit
VAVVADSTWAAMQGKRALKVEWDDSGFEHVNTAAIYKQQKENVQTKEGISFKKQGDANAVLLKAKKSWMSFTRHLINTMPAWSR